MRELWEHQKEALRRARLLPRNNPQDAGYGLFFEPGTGKTATAIHWLRELMNENQIFFRTLIFCPPIVVPNWADEFALNSKISREKITLLQGSAKQRISLFHERAFPKDDNSAQFGSRLPHIFITNYESLLMKELYALFRLYQPEAVVFDESHQLKSHTAKRSKFAERLANAGPIIPFKQILSGTPVLNDAMDLFFQFLVLDGGRTLGGNFFAFRARFFRDRNSGMPSHRHFPKWELMSLQKDGFDAEAEIARIIAPRAMAVKKSECLDLPPMVRKVIKVPLSGEQKRLYNEMKRDFLTYFKDEACVATLAITKALRLQQIASGYVKTVQGDEHELDETPKADALRELLQEITPTGKVLVWAVWRNNYAQIRAVLDALKLQYVEVHGEISRAQQDAAVHRFNTDPDCRVFLGHPGSGGIGINLVAASSSIFYSRTFALAHSIQAEARNYRGGSEIHEKITRYDIVCEDTIDEIVTKKLAEKIELSDSLLKELVYELGEQ